MRHDIFIFLQSAGFEIAPSTLNNIQGKEYRAIYEFLVLNLDPVYPFSSGRFEDDFAPALKALRYPYSHSLDNRWLAAPASMHSWPPLLGVLHWLVEMCKVSPVGPSVVVDSNPISSEMSTSQVAILLCKILRGFLKSLMTRWTIKHLHSSIMNMHTKCG